tara:strand:+ start:849 stop:1622 length:774 start_codon:yes stop_codon:yes gene_type:complete
MQIQLYLDSYCYKKLSGTLVPDCKKCESKNLKKDGKYKDFQQYKCKECGFRFSYASDLPRRRFPSSIIHFAVSLYVSTGISLRNVAKKVLKFFKTKVSHKTIQSWVKTFQVPEINLKTGAIWHADETSIKIKGKLYWLWLVIDSKTRLIISWRLSKDRTLEDAKQLMLEAKEKAGIPNLIITDGLAAYIKAIKKVFGWRNKVHHRAKSAAFGPNSIIERLNREVKRRVKWFSTFQSFDCAENFIQQWINNYNTEKVT